MKAIIYIRVSTDRQAMEGVSLEAQEARARAYCAAAGLEVAGVYRDEGISGKDVKHRPGLLAALDAACTHRAALVAYSLSRLARSTRDALDIADRLDRAGADLVSLSEKIDTTSAAGKMIFRMLAVLAEFERDQVAERTRAALRHMKNVGRKTGGLAPYGWTVDGSGRLIEHPDQQAALRLIRELRAAGHTYAAIIEELDRRAIPSKTGGRWHPGTIKQIIDRDHNQAAA